jgi:hypothetical protein
MSQYTHHNKFTQLFKRTLTKGNYKNVQFKVKYTTVMKKQGYILLTKFQ